MKDSVPPEPWVPTLYHMVSPVKPLNFFLNSNIENYRKCPKVISIFHPVIPAKENATVKLNAGILQTSLSKQVILTMQQTVVIQLSLARSRTRVRFPVSKESKKERSGGWEEKKNNNDPEEFSETNTNYPLRSVVLSAQFLLQVGLAEL